MIAIDSYEFMKRYWIPKEWIIEEETILLEGEIFHHIHRVCRNEEGSKFELLAEGGQAYFVELTQAKKKSGEAKILEVRKIPPLPRPHIHLALSIPRFQKMDWLIEKSVEMGVFSFYPFVSDYSFVKNIDGSLLKKEKRWQKIVQSATQQSGRGDLMKVQPPQSLDQLLQTFNQQAHRVGLFPYEGEAPQSINDAMQTLKQAEGFADLQDVWIFVGSEGGFSVQEVQLFQEFGMQPLTLGQQVLRVDTACLAMISIIKYELRLMEGK